jgi:Glycosyltransferase like family
MNPGRSVHLDRDSPRAAAEALSFVVCCSDDAILEKNLLASPCLGPGSLHEVIVLKRAPNAASGLNLGLERAKYELVVCVHQDVYLPAGWDRLMLNQYRMAGRQFGPIGAAGVYGVGPVGGGLDARRVGWVEDRGRVLSDGPGLPAPVATLDELLLVVPRDSPLRFEPELGFHLYGADLCLQAAESGLTVVALGAPCRHNSRSIGLPPEFFSSANAFARKWAHRLPVATPCVVFDRDGGLHVLGNADARAGSVARAAGLNGRGSDFPACLGSTCRSRLLPAIGPGSNGSGAGAPSYSRPCGSGSGWKARPTKKDLP